MLNRIRHIPVSPLAEVAIFFFTALCYAGEGDVLQSDAAPLTQTEQQGFLEKICPGQAMAPLTRGVWPAETVCSVCPKESSGVFSGDNWYLQAVTFGHFLTPKSEDALISGMGCEPHVRGSGGTFLLTKEGDSWRKVWYTAGEHAGDCKKVKSSQGRDLLICYFLDTGHSAEWASLYLLDPGHFLHGDYGRSEQMFFNVMNPDDRSAWPDSAPGDMGTINSVSFVSMPRHSIRIIVNGHGGKSFLFDGHKIAPTQRASDKSRFRE